MKTFFHTIKRTFCSKDLYIQAQHESGWLGIKLLMKLVLFLGTAFGIIGIVVWIIFGPALKSKVISFVQSTYPEGLVVSFTDGVMTTNNASPVSFPIPEGWQDKDTEDKNVPPTNFLVLTPDEEVSVSSITKYDSFAVAGKTSIIAGDEGEFRSYTYPKSTETITKDILVTMVTKMLQVVHTILTVLGIPITIMMFIGIAVAHLLWLLIIALVLFIIFKIRKQHLTYKQIYKMGIYALVPVMLIELVAIPLDLSGALLTMVIVMVIILVSTHSTSELPAVESENHS